MKEAETKGFFRAVAEFTRKQLDGALAPIVGRLAELEARPVVPGPAGPAGEPGRDGVSLRHVGTYNPETVYSEGEAVAVNGASFVALKNAPEACPGPDWQLVAGQGKRGHKGEPGDRGATGAQGPPGPAVEKMEITDDAILSLHNADGSVVTLDLYSLLSRLR